jgi:hypothetical protein
VLDAHVRWQANSWYVFGELLPSFDRAKHGAILEALLKRVAKAPGVARVIRPEQFEALGYPDYDDNPFVPGQYIIAGEPDTHLVIEADRSDTARRLRPRPYHGHGYLPEHPSMHPLLVLSGAGVAAGKRIGHVHNVDVAPTIAALLGFEMPNVEGRVLREALQR